MFTLALLIGIYSYLIFGLGLLGLLYKLYIVLTTVVCVAMLTYFNREILIRKILQYFNVLKKDSQAIKRKPFLKFLIILVVLQAVVNFTGALGPELGFDALWYHLTIPKMYLNIHELVHIPGSLLYYSTMPKLTEMLYVSGLSFGNEITAKFIHFSFGILSLAALYNLSRKFLSKTLSLLVLIVFYSNLVVGWMSITAYVDLARTFFEIMALWGFLEWQETKKQKWLIVCAILLGLAISTKLLAIGSLFVFTVLILLSLVKSYKITLKSAITNILVYWCFALLVPLPWFIFSFIHTGSPFYPVFSNLYKLPLELSLINPLKFFHDVWIIFTQSADPLSPFYIIFLPIAFISIGKMNLKLKTVVFYSMLTLLVWYITPRTGGGRFILPYLPAFSIVIVVIISTIRKVKIQYILTGAIISFVVFSIIYRGGANLKYIPVILGKESKAHFLSNNLNFSYGDFYDTDGYFAKKIKQKDTVLLYGFHNLYHVNFSFIDSSYVKKGDMFNYIAVQGDNLPERFKIWSLIYYNDKTNVKLYSAGGLKWVY